MKSLLRELMLWALSLLAASALVTGIALVLASCGVQEPGRWARKGLVPFVLLAFAWIARLTWTSLRRDLGVHPGGPIAGLRLYLAGFVAGVTSLLPLCAALVLLGAFRFVPDRFWPELWDRGPRYFFAAIPLVVLEELLFRALLHSRLQRAAGTVVAVLLGAALFSTAHFLKVPPGRPSDGFAGALDAATGAFAGLGVLADRWTEWVGLLGVGLVLSVLRLRSGGLLLPMGVHAGWFWVRSVDGAMLEEVRDVLAAHEPWLVTKRYYDGVLGWLAIASVVLIVMLAQRRARDVVVDPAVEERS